MFSYLLLLDFGLPNSQGMETLARVQLASDELPIVALTGLDDRAFAVEVVRAGAQNYLVKGRFDSELLIRTLHYAAERKLAEQEVRRLNAALHTANETLEQRVTERTIELAVANKNLRASREAALGFPGQVGQQLIPNRLGRAESGTQFGVRRLFGLSDKGIRRHNPVYPRAISFRTLPSGASSWRCSGIWPTAWVEQLKHGS